MFRREPKTCFDLQAELASPLEGRVRRAGFRQAHGSCGAFALLMPVVFILLW